MAHGQDFCFKKSAAGKSYQRKCAAGMIFSTES
jgi:hypothetical protein